MAQLGINLCTILGNGLSALTFMLTKLRNVPSSYYMTALAFADSGMLLCHLMLMTDNRHTLQAMPGICQLTLYIGGVFSFLSVWYVVSFTLERYIAVRYPLQRLQWCTIKRARCMVASIAIFACIFNSHILISASPSVDTASNSTTCSVQEKYLEIANTMNHIDTVLTFLIPLVLIAFWNAAIIATTVCSKRRNAILSASFRRHSTNRGTPGDDGMMAGLLLPALVSETFLGGQLRSHVRKKINDDRRMTCTLLVVSLVFLFMNFPDHVVRMVIYGLYRTKTWDTLSDAQQCWMAAAQKITTILFNTNFAINFFLYSLIGANFRLHLKKLLLRSFCLE